MKLKYTLFIVFSILLSISITEIFLRYFGFKPGYFESYKGFTTVDSLKTYDLYQTDDFGIYKFNTSYIRKLYNLSLQNNVSKEIKKLVGQEDVDDIYGSFNVLKHEIINGDTSDFTMPFPKFCSQVFQNESNDSTYKDLIRKYLKEPYNEDGFRSIPFESSGKSKRKRILLLGDSFVYGMSANPYYQSYSDILITKGYIVYNTGIPGVDPAQYSAVASKYIPYLKPDLVILNFYPGNDLMLFPREPKHNQPHEHLTNAGFLMSNPLGKYMNATEVYNYYNSLVHIPENENLFNSLCSKLSVTSILWKVLYKANYVNHPTLDSYSMIRDTTSTEKKVEITKTYISRIVRLCTDSEIPLLIAVIPENPKNTNAGDFFNKYFVDELHLNLLFDTIPYYYPKNIKPEDYESSGDHFNNSGSVKFADFLDNQIIQILNE